MKRDCRIVIGGLIPVVLMALLPQGYLAGALVLLILLGIVLLAILIPRTMEMQRDLQNKTSKQSHTPTVFWVVNQSFRNQ